MLRRKYFSVKFSTFKMISLCVCNVVVFFMNSDVYCVVITQFSIYISNFGANADNY